MAAQANELVKIYSGNLSMTWQYDLCITRNFRVICEKPTPIMHSNENPHF